MLQSSWLYCGSSRLEHILASKIKIYGSAQRYFCEHDTCTMHSYRAHNSVRVRDSSWKKDEGTPVQTPQDISSSMSFLEPLTGNIPLKKIGTDVCGTSQGQEVDCLKKLQGNRTCTPKKSCAVVVHTVTLWHAHNAHAHSRECVVHVSSEALTGKYGCVRTHPPARA